jgi:hypothetical protein
MKLLNMFISLHVFDSYEKYLFIVRKRSMKAYPNERKCVWLSMYAHNIKS